MTLKVFTKVAPSGIHGLGLFADQLIPAGTVIWKDEPALDVRYRLDYILSLSEPEQKMLATYCYEDQAKPGHYILCGDGARHYNHSDTPNTLGDGDCDIAARDIHPGEEITTDYASFGAVVAPLNWAAEAVRHENLLAAWAGIRKKSTNGTRSPWAPSQDPPEAAAG